MAAPTLLAALNRAIAERYAAGRRAMSPAGFVPACAGCDPPAPLGARKDGQTRTLQQAVECVGQAYRERSRGHDSPLGIAGALVLEGGVHRWRQFRMTETSRYPLRSQTRPGRARCAGFDRFYEIHLFETA